MLNPWPQRVTWLSIDARELTFMKRPRSLGTPPGDTLVIDPGMGGRGTWMMCWLLRPGASEIGTRWRVRSVSARCCFFFYTDLYTLCFPPHLDTVF